MRIVVAVAWLSVMSAIAAGGEAPKTASGWADLAAGKLASIPDANQDAYDWLQIAKVYADANEPKKAAGLLAKVKAFANTEKEEQCKAMYLLDIARVQAVLKDRDGCRETLKAAEAAVSMLSDDFPGFGNEWSDLAVIYLQIGDVKAAANTASKARDRSRWARDLAFMARRQAWVRQFEVAFAALKLAEENVEADDRLRQDLQMARACVLASQGDLNRSQELANGLEDPEQKVKALADVATAARRAGKDKLWPKLVDQAIRIADAQESRWRRQKSYSALLGSLLDAGLWDKAGEMADKLPEGQERTEAWTNIAMAQLGAGQTEAAKTTLQKVQKLYDAPWPSTQPGVPGRKSEYTRDCIIELYAGTGQLDRAVKMYADFESKRGARSGIGSSAAVAGHGEALMKWAETLPPAEAVEVYLGAAEGLVRHAKFYPDAKPSPLAKP